MTFDSLQPYFLFLLCGMFEYQYCPVWKGGLQRVEITGKVKVKQELSRKSCVGSEDPYILQGSQVE